MVNYDEFKARLDAVAPGRFEEDKQVGGFTLVTFTGKQLGLWVPSVGSHQFFVDYSGKAIGTGLSLSAALDHTEKVVKAKQEKLLEAIEDLRLMRQALNPVIREDDAC